MSSYASLQSKAPGGMQRQISYLISYDYVQQKKRKEKEKTNFVETTQKQILMYTVRNSLTFRHKINIDGLTCL